VDVNTPDRAARFSAVALEIAQFCPAASKRSNRRALEEQAVAVPYQVVQDGAHEAVAEPAAPGLRRGVQAMFRRMPDDRFIGVADVLRYEARRGGRPHLARA
jgi:hypothetical protein